MSVTSIQLGPAAYRGQPAKLCQYWNSENIENQVAKSECCVACLKSVLTVMLAHDDHYNGRILERFAFQLV